MKLVSKDGQSGEEALRLTADALSASAGVCASGRLRTKTACAGNINNSIPAALK